MCVCVCVLESYHNEVQLTETRIRTTPSVVVVVVTIFTFCYRYWPPITGVDSFFSFQLFEDQSYLGSLNVYSVPYLHLPPAGLQTYTYTYMHTLADIYIDRSDSFLLFSFLSVYCTPD